MEYQTLDRQVNLMAEKETPEHIEEFYKKEKQFRKLLATTELEHSKAYDNAVDVIKDDKGQVDYDLLKNDSKRAEFVKKLSNHYFQAAKKALKSDIGEDASELEKNVLLNAYMGTTEAQLKHGVDSRRQNYTKKTHNEISDSLMAKIQEKLAPVLSSHLKEEHVPGIVDYIEADQFIDSEKIRLPEVLQFLSAYDKGKGQKVSRNLIEGKPYEKKETENKKAA